MSKMAPTPSSSSSSKSNQSHFNHLKTPQSKHRLVFNSSKISHPSPNPNLQETLSPNPDHPVEVIGRIRNLPDSKQDNKPPVSSFFQINPDHQTIRIKTEIGYRDFTLDGVCSSEEDDLEGFYKKFIESRILGVKMGAKCTIMMYGPTGSGKSHTMFGSLKHQGIVYRALKNILEERENEEGSNGVGMFVQVTVLEIYNEEIYDLLNCEKGGSGSFNLWSKGSASKVKLEVMGKKAKNATFISGNEAGKILKEIQKVERRRIVKSTNCNDRSSRSHCMIILDAPTVGGRLMLVDMAGSENIEQAGQVGFEAKMQTGKINQGNIALKRVVESIANGDSHVPFRDSKLTMLLQDSFEDDKSKILMILCASPDPKEMHKTISTLEYGAKAKCIVRGPHTPVKDKTEDSSSAVIMGSRITAMDQFIMKLQMENKQREKECNEARKQLLKKEEEVSQLRAKLEQAGASEEEINEKINERTQMLRKEIEKQLEECQRIANGYVELEKRRMEEKMKQQEEEVRMLKRRLQEMELELSRSRDGSGSSSGDESGIEFEGSGLTRRLKEVYADEDPGMEKSMDLDTEDQESFSREVKIVGQSPLNKLNGSHAPSIIGDKGWLSTVFEEEEVEDEDEDEDGRKASLEDDEVEKKVIEEKKASGLVFDNEEKKLTPTSRKTRIENIFTLCGNYREVSHQTLVYATQDADPISLIDCNSKENVNPTSDEKNDGRMEVYVKWEATKENPGKFINKLKVVKDATLADLRKLIEIHLGTDKEDFFFLSLEDPTGAPISREKEATVFANKLPTCNTQLGGHLASLRPAKGVSSPAAPYLPLASLENKLAATPLFSHLKKIGDVFSPNRDSNMGPATPVYNTVCQ